MEVATSDAGPESDPSDENSTKCRQADKIMYKECKKTRTIEVNTEVNSPSTVTYIKFPSHEDAFIIWI
jgi:hypothetical protein